MSSKPTIAFVFPGRIDHVEPTLPLCRGLVKRELQVEYVCDAAFRDAIQETGAIFHDASWHLMDLYGPEDWAEDWAKSEVDLVTLEVTYLRPSQTDRLPEYMYFEINL